MQRYKNDGDDALSKYVWIEHLLQHDTCIMTVVLLLNWSLGILEKWKQMISYMVICLFHTATRLVFRVTQANQQSVRYFRNIVVRW
jgi:hypothetical protein